MKLKRLIVTLWEATQVEQRGRYSPEGILELTTYANEASWLRVIAVLVATPLPCLVTTVLIDTLPLADPSEGVQANAMYFQRSYYTYLVMTFLAIHQFHVSVPVLPCILWREVGSTLVVAAVTVGILYALSTVVGFPLPFSILTVTPPWLLLITFTLILEWGRKVNETPGAAMMLVNSAKLWMCQVLLVFTYPSYFYVFTTLSKGGKTAFAILLPFLKLFMKNLFARTVVHLRDEMPEVVVFNVELFNALFVSYCMQNSPSLWITLELMVVDVAMMGFSLRGAVSARRSLKDLERRISQRSSWESLDDRYSSVTTTRTSTLRRSSTRLTTLDRASLLLHLHGGQTTTITPFNVPTTTTAAPTTSLISEVMGRTKTKRKNAIKTSLKVMIKNSSSTPGPTQHPIRLARIFFGRDKIHPAFDADENGMAKLPVRYTHKVQRLVYAAEFLLLLNYVDVVIPLVFSFYLLVMYSLPNREYYAQLRGMTHFELFHTLRSVQLYCSLQLVSLLVLFLALQRVLGLSPIHQLAYVLEKRYSGVQLKLVFWVYYNVQASLQHSGISSSDASASSASQSVRPDAVDKAWILTCHYTAPSSLGHSEGIAPYRLTFRLNPSRTEVECEVDVGSSGSYLPPLAASCVHAMSSGSYLPPLNGAWVFRVLSSSPHHDALHHRQA